MSMLSRRHVFLVCSKPIGENNGPKKGEGIKSMKNNAEEQ